MKTFEDHINDVMNENISAVNIGMNIAEFELSKSVLLLAADRYAKSLANQAVKEDRERIIQANPSDIFQNGIGDVTAKINMIKLAKIPLPYPEI